MLDDQSPENIHHTPVSLPSLHFLLFLIFHNRSDQHKFQGYRKDIFKNPFVLAFSPKCING